MQCVCDEQKGETPLIAACRYGQTAMVEMLLNKGADFHHQTKVCVSSMLVMPLHVEYMTDDACMCGGELCHFFAGLSEYSLNPNDKGWDKGHLPLDFSC